MARGLSGTGEARAALSDAIEQLALEEFTFDKFVRVFTDTVDTAADDVALLRRLLDVALSVKWEAERAACLGCVAGALRVAGAADAAAAPCER